MKAEKRASRCTLRYVCTHVNTTATDDVRANRRSSETELASFGSRADLFSLMRALLDRCPFRGDPVPEIGIDVIRYAPNRYPAGKSEREWREKEGRARSLKKLLPDCIETARLVNTVFVYHRSDWRVLV